MLQPCFRHDANGAARSRAIDANDFPIAVPDTYQAKRIGRLETRLDGQLPLKSLAPDRFGGVVDRINPAVEACAHQSGNRREALKGRNVAAPGLDMRFDLVGGQPGLRLDPVEHARQDRPFNVAIAQPSDRADRDRNQRNHGDGEPGS